MPPTIGMDPTPFNDTDSTRRFERALVFAARAHAGTNRKGTSIPYITHPVQVARILERYGFDENLVIAGLLHDVIEDENVPPGEAGRTLRAPGAGVGLCGDREEGGRNRGSTTMGSSQA
jgi:hypothetical protein